ncbi:hypothetical protein HanOQP8_Chr11g0415311 [Helianthus annuus]|nr:hypothetical protein HanHA89_Chr11g0436561 [Helianthus annuus]KAJ0686394.1 hypothetical protein HanLR1_Chr11g0414221 [Helianthus annuus]KAJ0690215.1 hypothetical protein HanOQP8_Chr11g0415311 [Helianthus annuus]
MGKYHNTLAGGPFFVTSSSTSSVSFLRLYLDAPQLSQLCFFSNSFRYNIQSFGDACILSTSNLNFFAWYVKIGN